ncbi:MAG TPA: hypothetical protein VGZ93_06460 [Candidatus Methylacidiphilales bacterium]|nr:hypothetical protein [Candidatus Methylacidiphilales bacterium]
MKKADCFELVTLIVFPIFGLNFAAVAAAVLYSLHEAHVTHIENSEQGQLLLVYVLILTLFSTACFIIAPRFARFVRPRCERKLGQALP